MIVEAKQVQYKICLWALLWAFFFCILFMHTSIFFVCAHTWDNKQKSYVLEPVCWVSLQLKLMCCLDLKLKDEDVSQSHLLLIIALDVYSVKT